MLSSLNNRLPSPDYKHAFSRLSSHDVLWDFSHLNNLSWPPSVIPKYTHKHAHTHTHKHTYMSSTLNTQYVPKFGFLTYHTHTDKFCSVCTQLTHLHMPNLHRTMEWYVGRSWSLHAGQIHFSPTLAFPPLPSSSPLTSTGFWCSSMHSLW